MGFWGSGVRGFWSSARVQRHLKPLSFGIYEPPGSGRGAWPVVLFVTGYNDLGMERLIGCKAKDMASYAGWGRLVATQGIAA